MKMRKNLLIIALLIIPLFTLEAQEANRRIENKLGVGFQLLGPTYMGSFEVDYFVTHNFNLEAGTGFFGIYAGGKYFFGKADTPKPWAPYTGVLYKFPGLLTGDDEGGFYFPFGIQYMSKRGFTFAPEYAFIRTGAYTSPLFGAIRIGWHF